MGHPDEGKASGLNAVALSPFPCFRQLLGQHHPLSGWLLCCNKVAIALLGFIFDYHYVQKEKEHHFWQLALKSRGPSFPAAPRQKHCPPHPISAAFTESYGSIPLAKGVPCADWLRPGFLNQPLACGMGLQSDAAKKYKGSVRRRKGN